MKIKDIDCFLFDLDGTLYLEGEPIEGAIEKIAYLKKQGKKVCFVTNNSSKSAFICFEKLNSMGFDVQKEEVWTSGVAAIDLINRSYKGARVLLLGNSALLGEFKAKGINLVEDEPEILVLAFDTEITYEKIKRFNHYLGKGALYIATHADLTCPFPEVYIPDAGSFIAMFEKSAGRLPDIITGKPFGYLADAVLNSMGTSRERTAICGDRLYTDIAFGAQNGLKSILVLSGDTKKEEYEASKLRADYVLNSVKDIEV